MKILNTKMTNKLPLSHSVNALNHFVEALLGTNLKKKKISVLLSHFLATGDS